VLDTIVVFDLETTGVDVHEDRIVTSFMGRVSPNGELTWPKSWLVNPGIPIPEGASAVHGVYDKDVVKAAKPEEAIRDIIGVIEWCNQFNVPVAGFNLAYDLTLLYYEAVRYGFTPVIPDMVIDGYIIDKRIDPYRKGKRTLVAQAATYGIEFDGAAHDAEADAVVSGKLIYRLLEDPYIKTLRLDKLHELQKSWAKEQAAGLQAYFRRTDPKAVVNGDWPLKLKEEDK